MSKKSVADCRNEILNYGGMPPYDTFEVVAIVGAASPMALHELRIQGKLLGLPIDGLYPQLGAHKIFYPRWQFDADVKLLPGLEEILMAAPQKDPWGVADILTSPQEIFNDRAPIEALKDENVSDTVQKTIALIRCTYE
jgi:hypothetical protein